MQAGVGVWDRTGREKGGTKHNKTSEKGKKKRASTP